MFKLGMSYVCAEETGSKVSVRASGVRSAGDQQLGACCTEEKR